jgi:hypothetical protein
MIGGQMAAHAVTLRLPAPLYDRLSSRAERAQRSLEAELLEAVATIAAEEEESSREVAEAVAALELLSDADLWRAARNPLAEADRSRLEALNLKQQRESLTPTEKERPGKAASPIRPGCSVARRSGTAPQATRS